MVAYDKLTEEIQRSCIRLNDELIFSPQKYQEDYFVHIEIPSTSKFFRISRSEYLFISLLDGRTSFSSALATSSQSLGENAIDEDKCTQLILWLLENGMATVAGAAPAIISSQSPTKPSEHWLRKVNPFWTKLSFGNPSSLLLFVGKYLAWIFHPIAILISVAILFVATLLGLSHFDQLLASSKSILAPENMLVAVILWIVLKVIHELAHALVCQRLGGTVRESGVIMILFAPMAYVDVSSSWRLKCRWYRIAVAAAGIYAELCIAAICVCLWFLSDSEFAKQQLMNVVIMSGIATLLFNANPLMRFDGYFILSDLLQIPNLYSSGIDAFRRHMNWLFLGKKPQRSRTELARRPVFIAIYGYLAMAWKVIVCIGLAISASVMFQGLGLVLAGVGVLCWTAKPLTAIVKTLVRAKTKRPQAVVRAFAVTGVGFGLLCFAWLAMPNPFSVRCPCIISFEDSAKVRADSAGFVKRVLVVNGQSVEKGTPLLELSNLQLMSEIEQLQAELKFHETKQRIAIQQGDAAKAQMAASDYEATASALSTRQKESDNLVLCAPNSGRVISLHLDQLRDQYVNEGDHLLTIGNEATKEVVVLIAPDEASVTSELVGQSLQIEIGSRRRMHATIVRLDPKASLAVLQPKLISTHGGSLPVKPAAVTQGADSQLEFVTPQVQAIAKVKKIASENLVAGERGMAVVGSKSSTLGIFLYEKINRWLRKQMDHAADVSQKN
ncbi:MAG: efflux RND transporter periplasmic adaptor subunit [Planctomycetota bacterium]